MLNHFLQTHGILHVAPDGQMRPDFAPPIALLPGSFNPLHRAHLALAQVAEQILGQGVAFELSVVNVDKPTLSHDEIRRRLTQFAWRASVWLTHAPRFIDKAERFPGTTFVVGADTALRIVSPRYYDDDEAQMLSALASLRERDCRFLVACRADAGGKCLTLDDVPIRPGARDLFQSIAPEQFRWTLSSTELRALGHTL